MADLPRPVAHDRQTGGRVEKLARYDLRVRSIDREPGAAVNVCCAESCHEVANWSVWLHTPEWDANGGGTYVRCTPHALSLLMIHTDDADVSRRAVPDA